MYPQVGEDEGITLVEPIYFYQDAWAFEQIVRLSPDRHIDVGSHHKFVALLSKLIPVTMVDIRPLSVQLDSLDFKEGSILDLPFDDQTLDSVSSLCVVEHIGLGRYGDSLDPFGTERAVEELVRVVRRGGWLFVSTHIDDVTRTVFNAHRAFAEDYFLSLFGGGFTLAETVYIYGNRLTRQRETGFGTGCYAFRRD